MTTRYACIVAVEWMGRIQELVGDIAASASRALKADPGDRSEVVRYERLCSSLEGLAWQAATDGATIFTVDGAPDGAGLPFATPDLSTPLGPSLIDRLTGPAADTARAWLADGAAVVLVTLAFCPTGAPGTVRDESAPDVAATWSSADGEAGARAAEARFRDQVQAAVEGASTRTREVINPSGVHNRVLTQVLHTYAQGHPSTRVDAPIAYRDGSAASNPFPLRCMPLAPTCAPPSTSICISPSCQSGTRRWIPSSTAPGCEMPKSLARGQPRKPTILCSVPASRNWSP